MSTWDERASGRYWRFSNSMSLRERRARISSLFPFEEALKELVDTFLNYLAGVQRDGGGADRTCDLERHHDSTLPVLEKGNRFAATATGGNIRRQGHLDPKIQRWRGQTHLAATHRLH